MSNYWTKRFEEEEKQRNISNKAYAKEIEKQYKIAENKIKSDIEKWYMGYGYSYIPYNMWKLAACGIFDF